MKHQQARIGMRRIARRQRGVALIFGMIILLILTIIGITAIRSTTQQERMVAASQQQAQSFEAADSAVHYVIGQLFGTDPGIPKNPADLLGNAVAADSATGWYTPADPEAAAPTIPATAQTITPATSDPHITSNARLYCVGSAGLPLSGNSVNKFSTYRFYIDATASEPGTGASVRTVQEIGYLAPKTSGS